MDQQSQYIESSITEKETSFEAPLRPQSLEEFTGQDIVRERLRIIIQAALKRGEPLDHCLFCGPPGLGKTTLAGILAKAMGTNLVVTSGPVIEKAGDLAGVLTNLQVGDILFIDELHRLSRTVEEYLYPAMEDFSLDLMIDTGPSARSVQVKLNHFTLVGATTRLGLITSPMRSRFGFSSRLEYYEPKILEHILHRTAKILQLQLTDEAASAIAKRARGTPRIANNLLRWVRDFAQVNEAFKKVSGDLAIEALNMLAIDERGLDEMDKKILSVMIDHHHGGPVGINTIAAAIGEESTTIEEVHEPFLIMQGYIRRTPRGREVLDLAYDHLQKKHRHKQE